ncbi:DUF2563 family protein [Nocardia sp. NEAU-G5]|uniref:DUF2563 family protein n=2 Tax=Nocardia albiluteola TaxID=2842303 RepID=A0ABS6AYA1_9NOCA|nr:DUF2563 family protein [Nocardia albiluteola]
MYADLDRLALGSYHTDTAADHVRAARQHLESSEAMNGMFGQTESAPRAHVVVHGAHKQQIGELGGHLQNLTSIYEKATSSRSGFRETDRAAADYTRMRSIAEHE